MLASASVLGRVELGSFGVAICVGNCILKWNNMCLPGELRYRSFQTDFWLICSTMMPIPSGKLTNCVLSFEGAHAHCQTYELCSQFRSRRTNSLHWIFECVAHSIMVPSFFVPFM